MRIVAPRGREIVAHAEANDIRSACRHQIQIRTFLNKQDARRISDAGEDAARQVERAWRLAFSRPPADREARAARSFVAKHGLAELCLVLFNANEFLYID